MVSLFFPHSLFSFFKMYGRFALFQLLFLQVTDFFLLLYLICYYCHPVYLLSISRKLMWILLYFPWLYLTCSIFFSFLSISAMVIVTISMSLPANSVIYIFVCVSTDWFFPPLLWNIFSCFCVHLKFLIRCRFLTVWATREAKLDVWCCKFNPVECWIFLYFYKYSCIVWGHC